jgi:DNA-binding PadR family transcriptional regulator
VPIEDRTLGSTQEGAVMRSARGIRYALLGVVSQNPNGVHGYALKRQCERVLGNFWQLNFGEVYRVLDRLANDGLIEQVIAETESGRKVYRITEKGKRSLDDFVLEPPQDAPRPLRQELAVKLLFASPGRLGEVVRLIDHQREAYMRQLSLLGVQRRRLQRAPIDSFVTNLLIDGAELAVRAELAWLDDVTQKLKERFTILA